MKRHILAAAVFVVAASAATAASAQSYGLRATCPQLWDNGPFLTAVCYNAFGGLNRSSIDRRACGYGGIGNVNGQLTCLGGGGGGYEGGYRRHRPRGQNWE
jgi:hypothetical protein